MSPPGARILENGWCVHPVDTAALVREKIRARSTKMFEKEI